MFSLRNPFPFPRLSLLAALFFVLGGALGGTAPAEKRDGGKERMQVASTPPETHQRIAGQRHGRSLRGEVDQLPFVLLRGSVAERGEAYGAFCGVEVARMLESTLIPAVNKGDPRGWSDLIRMVDERFVFPGETQEQMEAFMRGLQKTATAEERLMPSLGRELLVQDLKLLQAFPDLASSRRIEFGGCSSFSAWGALTPGGGAIAGRNMDYRTFPGAMPVLLIAQEPEEGGKLRTLEVAIPGMFGASTAMNEEGVLAMLHDEPGLRSARQKGWVPRVTALRRAVEIARRASAVEDVAGALRRVPVMMGGNVHVTFPRVPDRPERTPVVMEWDGSDEGEGITVRSATLGDGLPAIFCTNHFLQRRKEPGGGSSAQRYNSLHRAAQEQLMRQEAIQLPVAQKMMDRVAVRGGVSTYFSVITLPEKLQMFIAVAPRRGASATDGRWAEIQWSDIFGL